MQISEKKRYQSRLGRKKNGIVKKKGKFMQYVVGAQRYRIQLLEKTIVNYQI